MPAVSSPSMCETAPSLRFATYPNHDPSDFVFGMSSSQYQSLLDRPDTPLLDRTIKGLYPAGSTFKHVTGYAALVSGKAANDYWNDQGVFTINSCTSAEKSGCQFPTPATPSTAT
ncbi:MAG: penicillin-binding transpeptidase domain-containing protein [Acidimicrobiales bacterium]